MHEGFVIAFDYGLRHIGVAAGQTVTGTASAQPDIQARDGRADFGAIDSLLSEWKPVLLVVGLPLNMDGTESDMAARARAFAAQLQNRYNLPVELMDERLTSREATALTGKNEGAHGAAAALIAESWLRAMYSQH